jgi:hypothetical protein
VSYSIYLAFGWTILGAIQLYRAYAGKLPSWIVTLNSLQSPLLSKKQRWMKAGFGICYLGFATAHTVLLYARHAHHTSA